MSTKNSLVLFGLGGCGTNIVSPYILSPLNSVDGRADIEGFLVDTSESNIMNDKVRSHFYKIKLNDDKRHEGSGGVRATNFEEIQSQVKNILLARKPGNVNVLVASGSGGSGGTAAVVLARELIQAGHPTVLILVVDDQSLIAARNSLNSIASIDGVAKKANIPFITYIVPNTSISEANKEIQHTISLLSMLFSNENFGLDNADTANFLNYTKVTASQAGIASLRITDKLEEGYNKHPITLAMLHTSQRMQEEARGKFVTAYSTEGIIRHNEQDVEKTFYFTTEFDDVNTIVAELKKTIESHEQQINAVNTVTVSVKTSGVSSDDGFVL